MKTVIAGLMLMCLASPISAEDPAQAEEQQQKSLTSLLDDIERQRTAKQFNKIHLQWSKIAIFVMS